MNKALRATILVVVFALSFVGTTLLLQGCGGGGGTTVGNNLSPAQLRGSANKIPAGQHLRMLSSDLPGINRSRSRQFGSCPSIREDGDQVIWDFGSGCYSDMLGATVRGRISARLVDPQYDQNGELISFSSIVLGFDAFGTLEETITGTMSLRDINREDALGLSYDLTLRGECEERERFNGTVVYSAGWFSDRFYITGNGDYAAPAVGTVSFQMRNVQYEFPDNLPGCDYPIGGQMTVTAGGQTGTVTFGSTCGIARVNIGGVEEDIDLDEIEFDACR
jgi:hypothetical protein